MSLIGKINVEENAINSNFLSKPIHQTTSEEKDVDSSNSCNLNDIDYSYDSDNSNDYKKYCSDDSE